MKDHAIAYVGAGIISILLFTSILGFIWNSRNKESLRDEIDKNESLEAENLMVQEELDKARKDYTALQIRNDSASERIASIESDLSARDRRIASLSNSTAALNSVRRELEQVKSDNEGLKNNLTGLEQEHDKVLAQNKELQNEVQDLQSQMNDITTQFNQSQKYDADNFETYASRGKNKDKLTVRARCAKRINMNFDVPVHLSDSVSFRIITPEGITIGPGDKNISWTFSDLQDLTAGLQGSGRQSGKRVDLKYTTTEKLARGEYQVKLISNNMNIGNCRLLLR